ncbi:MAG: SurA N-terminal domain-containing protein [Verrucomicrobiota bacterium]
MKNRILVLIGTALAAVCLSSFAATEVNGIAAVVNNQVVTKSEVRSAAQTQVQLLVMQEGRRLSASALEARVREIERNALRDLIDRELILSQFKELGAQIRDQHVDQAVDRFIRERFANDRNQFAKELANNGLTIKQFRELQRETIIVQAMRSRNAGVDDVIVTPVEREKFWRENPSLFSSDGFVKIRTITIPKTADGDSNSGPAQKVLVEEILSKLRSGADFATMARTHSVDSGAPNGGERGTFSKADLNSELAEVAFTIAPQTVSDVIDLGSFYTLVYVEARELGKITPLAEVEDEVHRRVLQNKRQNKVEAWLARLRRDANIRIFE